MSSAVARIPHLQCLACGHFSKSHFSLLQHTADAHPQRLDDMAVGRLGNVLISQPTAALFHCATCFFTSKTFPKLYEHVVFTHCQDVGEEPEGKEGRDEEEGEEGKEGEEGEEGEEAKEAKARASGGSAKVIVKEDVKAEGGQQGEPGPVEVCPLVVSNGMGYLCLVCGITLKCKLLAVKHSKRHKVPGEAAGDGGGAEERAQAPPRKPGFSLEGSDLHREEVEATARVLRKSRSSYVCLICGYKHRAKRYAISHVMRRHDPPCPYRCSQCSATYLLPSLLKQHAYLRHRPGRYGCPFCRFRSSVPHGFKRHCGNCRARGAEGEEEEEEEGEEEGEEGGDGSEGEEPAAEKEEVSVCP